MLLTGAVAWAVCRPIRRWSIERLEQIRDERHFGWIVHHRRWLIDRVVPLVTPAAWAIGLWIAMAVARKSAWPSEVTETAINLLAAWLIIRLGADVVPNAALAACRT